MDTNIWKLLQLFADGAAGDGGAGDGAAAAPAETGDTAGDADQRLRDLGVPEDKIRKHARSRRAAAAQAAPVQDDAATQAAETDKQAQTEGQTAKPSFEELMKDPDYNRAMQDTIKKRLREDSGASAILTQLQPMLEKLAQENGLDAKNLDYAALNNAVTGEYGKRAAELGLPEETVMQLDQQQRTIERQKLDTHFARMEAEAAQLKTVFPDFDLATEMQNPQFARLTHPDMHMSVEDAFYAVHRKELQAASMQAATQQTARLISNAIQSGQRRPAEAGATSQAPSVSTFDYTRASREQRDALKARIRQAAARGEKIYPGQR